MPRSNQRWTAAMVRELPDDGNRYEVIDGELLVTPLPTHLHQRAVTLLAVQLHEFVRANALGEVLVSPADIELDTSGLVQPDVFVLGLVDGRLPQGWNAGAPLLLAIEVLSPGTARYDRITKRQRFQRAGIPEFWIVDMDSRSVERWCPEDQRPEINAETLEWQPAPAASLRLNLAELFGRIHGEII